MRTHPGEILGDDDRFEPRIGSMSAQPPRMDFMRRHMRRRLPAPLKHLHPRGADELPD
jgi:hypothetical protein